MIIVKNSKAIVRAYIIPLCLLCWVGIGIAAADLYPFDTTQQSTQFSRLTQEVRCLVCQNQSIADSNASFAADLRAEVYRLVKQHETDQAIKTYLEQRYGPYILFNPPLASQTWVLWMAPLALVLLGFAGVLMVILRQSRSASKEVA